jgi:hypothetical protein
MERRCDAAASFLFSSCLFLSLLVSSRRYWGLDLLLVLSISHTADGEADGLV